MIIARKEAKLKPQKTTTIISPNLLDEMADGGSESSQHFHDCVVASRMELILKPLTNSVIKVTLQINKHNLVSGLINDH